MNKFQKQIVKEEFARAAMIKTAKESLSESSFRGFLSEMRIYENKSILTEGVEPQDRYNTFFKQLKESEDPETVPDGSDTESETVPGGSIKNFPQTLSGEAIAIIKKKGISDSREVADFILSNRKVFGDLDEIEALAYLKSALGDDYSKLYDDEGNKKAGGGAGGGAPSEPSGNIKVDTQNLGKELESPKAKGILSSIFDSYKFAFAANAKMWEKIYGFINGIGNKSPAEQEKAADQVENELETAMPNPPESAEEAEEGAGEEEGGSISIRKGKGSLQSRISKLFPDLAKKRGTYYYRQTDKEGDQGKIISKNTSALAAILGDIEAQLKGSGIEISENQMIHLAETIIIFSQGQLLTEAKLGSFKGGIRRVLQKVRDSEADPKKRKKKIDKFLYRLRAYAEKGDMQKFADRYKDIAGASSIASMYDTLPDDEKKAGVDYAKEYAQKQFTGDDGAGGLSVRNFRGRAAGEAPASMSKDQMIKMVPKIRSGIINISQIIGPKLKAAGYDLTSPEGSKVQQRLLKVLRRYLTKELERIGMSQKVKLLAKFSKSNPKKDKSVTESMNSIENDYIKYYSAYMLEGIMYELQS